MEDLYLPASRNYSKWQQSAFFGNTRLESACREIVNITRNSLNCALIKQQALFADFHLRHDPETASALLDLRDNKYLDDYRLGFFAELFRAHPEYPARWKRIDNSQHFGNMMASALWWANTPECRALYKTLRKDKGNQPDVELTRIDLSRTYPAEPFADEYPEIVNLDLAWGAFDATRDPSFLNGIILCALRKPTTEEPDLMKLAALWSILLRAANDENISQELSRCLVRLSPEQQKEYAAMETPDFDDISHFFSYGGNYIRYLHLAEKQKQEQSRQKKE